MSVPKKFNETVNFKNRIESLNNLTFYKVNYDYKLTESYRDNLNKLNLEENDINGVKEISALSEEQAKEKIKNWFKVLKEYDILKSYRIKSTKSRNFHEVLEDKKILAILQPYKQ